MDDLARRFAVVVLGFAGIVTLLLAWPAAAQPDAADAPLLLHRQVLVALLGFGLLLSVLFAGWRLPAAGAALLSKAALILLGASGAANLWIEAALSVLLLAAAAVLLRDALLEARFEGVLPLRQES